MANQILLKRGLEADRLTYTPAEGELIYTTDGKKLFIGDGTTAGGNEVTTDLSALEADQHNHSNKAILDATTASFLVTQETKINHISVTQAVDLDQIESDVAANNAKVTNATHTGDVTGSTVLTIAATAVNAPKIDWGTGTDQVSAEDMPIADAGTIFTATDVEGALQEAKALIDANTAKVSNATHTGDVTGSTVLTIAANAVDDSHINWGTAAGQVSAADMPIADSAGHFAATNVETALAEAYDDFEAFVATKGQANGLASLDGGGKVPAAQLPSFVDDVLFAATKADLVTDFVTNGTGFEDSKIYVAQDTNITYRWDGVNQDATGLIEISSSLALGETSSTAYRGDRGKIAYDHSQEAHAPADANNYIHPTKAEIGWEDKTTLDGAWVIDNLTINAEGHISGWSTRELDINADLGYTGDLNANNYVHPTTAGNKHIPVSGSTTQMLQYSAAGTAKWISVSGDVTIADGGAVTIEDSAVTLAKMADMATGSLIYRRTAGAGAPEVNSLATLKTDLGLAGTNSGDQSITGVVTSTSSGTTLTTSFADAAGLSVLMNATGTSAEPSFVAAASDHQVLRRSGSTIGFGSINLSQSAAVSGTLAVQRGGTGLSTVTSNGIMYGNGTGAVGVTSEGVWDGANQVGQLLSVNASGVPTWTDTIDGGTF